MEKERVSLENIRNFCILAPVDHGASTTIDYLLSSEQYPSSNVDVERACNNNYRCLRDEDAMTNWDTPRLIRPPIFSFQHSALNKDGTERSFLLNAIGANRSEHLLGSDLQSTVRLSDGVLFINDCVEGFHCSRDELDRAIINLKAKPILFVNKFDRMLFELQLSPDECFHSFMRLIESNNAGFIDRGEDIPFSPDLGNVIFGSALRGWGFSLETISRMYAEKMTLMPKNTPQGLTESELLDYKTRKLVRKLWGYNYFHVPLKSWHKTPNIVYQGKPVVLPLAFGRFVIEPLYQLWRAVDVHDVEKMKKMCSVIKVNFDDVDLDGTPRQIFTFIMKKWFPLRDAIFTAIIEHLPSPVSAQQSRLDILYDGHKDELSAISIKTCDESGPLVIYISRMISVFEQGASRMYAFGRVFSGRLSLGDQVRSIPAINKGSEGSHKIAKIYTPPTLIPHVPVRKNIIAANEVAVGDFVYLPGLDAVLVKSGTITTSMKTKGIRGEKLDLSDVLRVRVDSKFPNDVAKFQAAMTRVQNREHVTIMPTSDGRGYIVGGSGEMQLEIFLRDFHDHCSFELTVSDPFVKLRETVLRSSCNFLSLKPNNKLFTVNTTASTQEQLKALSNDRPVHISKYKLVKNDLILINPDDDDNTIVFSPLLELSPDLKESFDNAFVSIARNGILCGESLIGVKFEICDTSATQGSTPVTNSSLTECLYRCVLASQPALLEPIYSVEIKTRSSLIEYIYEILASRRGEIVSTEVIAECNNKDDPLQIVIAYVPVRDSFGLFAHMRSVCASNVSVNTCFDHWRIVDGNVFEDGSVPNRLMKAYRREKMLPDVDPLIEKYKSIGKS